MKMLAVAAVFAATVSAAFAAPPPNADPALASWFNGLSNPVTGLSCCATADGRVAKVRDGAKGGHEALIGVQWGQEPHWEPIPQNALLQNSDNPVGAWVVFWHPGMGILCAIRPAEV